MFAIEKSGTNKNSSKKPAFVAPTEQGKLVGYFFSTDMLLLAEQRRIGLTIRWPFICQSIHQSSSPRSGNM